jgi:hypothetical protein
MVASAAATPALTNAAHDGIACPCIVVGVAKSVRNDDPLAIAWATAIRTGDLATLERLLAANPDLANVQIEGRKGGYRTPLHVVAD